MTIYIYDAYCENEFYNIEEYSIDKQDISKNYKINYSFIDELNKKNINFLNQNFTINYDLINSDIKRKKIKSLFTNKLSKDKNNGSKKVIINKSNDNENDEHKEEKSIYDRLSTIEKKIDDLLTKVDKLIESDEAFKNEIKYE